MESRFEILYEDNHIMVVVKPPNMLTQGDRTGDEDLLGALKDDIKLRCNKPGNVYLGLVHRLDRPVGGAMVFAKTSKAASRLSEQVRNGTFEKTYMAVIHGVPEKPAGTLVHYLVKDENTNTVHVAEKTEDGKKAVLDYTILASAKKIAPAKGVETRKGIASCGARTAEDCLSLVKIKLHTGRSHQIRVQFAATSHPIYGDRKYGAYLNKPGMQLALWSMEIGFEHPTLKDWMSFSSTPPKTYPWSLF